MSSFEKGKPRSLSRRWIYVAVAVTTILVTLASFSVLALNRPQWKNDEANPPIPVVIGEHRFHTTALAGDCCAIITATVRNDGGAGVIIAKAMVKYEYGGSTFTQSQNIFFESGEEKEVIFIFSEITPLSCGNRHSYLHTFGVGLP